MRRYDLLTPEGTRDYLFEECRRKSAVDLEMERIFKHMGYAEVLTPGVEFFDVFNLNSRYFPQEELYKLTDNKGRLLVLRPDSTMPIARVVATRLKEAQLPLRLYYNQPVYRFEPSLKGRSAEVHQTGIELIGSDSPMADIEVISAAVSVLSGVGRNIAPDVDFTLPYSLELGDVRIFRELMNRLQATEKEKEEIRSLIEAKNYPALNDALDKLGDDRTIYALKKLPTLFGGEEVFRKAADIIQDERIGEILDSVQALYSKVCRIAEKGRITIDLGLVNKTDYYTGFVLKGYLEGYGEEVLSGGRYDKLLAEFGYDIPAVGMAVNADAVAEVISGMYRPQIRTPDILVAAEEGCEANAVRYAMQLREHGAYAECALTNDPEELRIYAQERKMKIVVVGEKIPEIEEDDYA